MYVRHSSPPWLYLILHFSHDRSNWSSPSPHFRTFNLFLIYFPKYPMWYTRVLTEFTAIDIVVLGCESVNWIQLADVMVYWWAVVMVWRNYELKMWWCPGWGGGHVWRHNMAHIRCMLRKLGYMLAQACTRPRARAHARTRARAHTHTHTHTNMQCLLLFHGSNDSRTRLNITLYIHCLPC